METTTASSNFGVVVSVRGNVVDIGFDGPMPPIDLVLRAGRNNKSSSICWRSGNVIAGFEALTGPRAQPRHG